MRIRSRRLQQTVFAEGEALAVADDDVVEDAHVEERECLLQAARDELVRLAGLEDAGRVVVGEYHRCRIVRERLAQDLTRVHAGAVDGAAEQLLEGDQAVAVIEVQAAYLYPSDKLRQGATG